MSTKKSEQRKSAAFAPEQMEQVWDSLPAIKNAPEKKEKPAIPKLKLVTDSENAGSQKQQDKSGWQNVVSGQSQAKEINKTVNQSVTQTVTQTITQTDTTTHSAPVITPRKQLRFASEADSDGGPGQEKKARDQTKLPTVLADKKFYRGKRQIQSAPDRPVSRPLLLP